MIDTILNNRYRLDATIGEGGMAIVYRGYDLLLRRQVAIKVLRPHYASDESFVQRFYEEARAAANLSHPNIVNTYDVGQVDGSHYIVEEFVAGETLATLIQREGKLPESIVIRFARQIALALGAAHRADLLHRDIKPSNVLITPDDVVRVTDFGIARAANAATLSGVEAIMGSIPYCSPEQLSGGALSPASDLYSLGVVLFEMVTGKRPYNAETTLGVAMAHVNAPIPDPAEHGAQISLELRDVILRLLQKAPGDRFQSAGETLAALRHLHHGDDVEGLEAGSDTPTAILRRRSHAEVGGGGGALPEPEPSWSVGRVLWLAGGVLALIVVLAVIIASREASSRGLTVPDLAGKPQVDAVAALHAIGIDTVSFRQRSDANIAAGLVDGSDPPASAPINPGTAVTLYLSSGAERAAVPNVVGKDIKTASALLSTAGFNVRMGSAVHSPSIRQGMIAQVNPAPGSPAEKGSTVVLQPSLGPETVRVPNVVSMSDDDARKQLTKLGLKFQATVINSVDIPAHTVIDQDPAGGSDVQPGTVVTADVSAGPNAVSVPNVVGTSVDDARAALEQAGLTLGRLAQAAVTDTSPGTIVSQDPAANAQVPQGTAVDIVVAMAPASPQPDVSATVAPTPSANVLAPIPNVVGMTVEDARAALEKAGYHVDHITVTPGSPANAKVTMTEPEPGATTPPGSNAVNLIVGGH